MFRAIFKNLMHFIRTSNSFIGFEAYFKALIHLLRLQLENFLFSQGIIHLFFSGFVRFY